MPLLEDTIMTKVIKDNSGERMEADSRHDSSEEEKDKRRSLVRGGV